MKLKTIKLCLELKMNVFLIKNVLQNFWRSIITNIKNIIESIVTDLVILLILKLKMNVFFIKNVLQNFWRSIITNIKNIKESIVTNLVILLTPQAPLTPQTPLNPLNPHFKNKIIKLLKIKS